MTTTISMAATNDERRQPSPFSISMAATNNNHSSHMELDKKLEMEDPEKKKKNEEKAAPTKYRLVTVKVFSH
uniref:Uncharacterized protein n=1 Tax=Cucumis melo TaxID=3656 RepID=A0A9I9EHL0_CUCME